MQAHSHGVYRDFTFFAGGNTPLAYPYVNSTALDTQSASAGGLETRPMNIAMMFFMAMG